METKDVFISYKAEEFAHADWVRTMLECRGIRCWMAPDSIPGGASYATEIPKAISACKVFVLILSTKAQESKWVPREVDQAINKSKTILPFMIENCRLTDEFQFYLSNVQCYTAFRDQNDAIDKMVAQIQFILHLGNETGAPQPPRASYSGMGSRPAGIGVQIPPAKAPVKPKETTDGVCIAALVMGILSCICLFPGIPAVILAVIGRSRVRKSGRTGKGLALAGMLLGQIGLFGLLILLFQVIGTGIWICILVITIILYWKKGNSTKGESKS